MNYQEQAHVNMLSFCSDEKFAEKKAFLMYLAQTFNKREVRWCLTCSSTLFFRGIATDFHDFDVLIDYQDISKALGVVKELNPQNLPKGDQTLFASTLFNKYKVGSVHFDLFSEWRISNMFDFEYSWREEDNEEFDIEGVTIKMVSARVQYILYSVFSPWYVRRLEQAAAVAEYLQDSSNVGSLMQ
ncbi:MAG: hypothetical protein IJH12_02335 [Clostridia bacterium]|nr:hypothetical protein [Clostridia bacterium]